MGILLLVIIIVVLFCMGIRLVRPFEKGVVERLGKYRRTAEPGFNWIIPYIDRMTKVDMRENVVDAPPPWKSSPKTTSPLPSTPSSITAQLTR